MALEDFAVVDLDLQLTVAVRFESELADLDIAAVFDEDMPRLVQTLTTEGSQPTGPPYARYFEFGPERVDLEVGIPVETPSGRPQVTNVDKGELGESALPAGRAATVVHRGDYGTLGEAYEALDEWIRDRGDTPETGPWESYVDDPGELEVSQDRTEIYWPVTS